MYYVLYVVNRFEVLNFVVWIMFFIFFIMYFYIFVYVILVQKVILCLDRKFSQFVFCCEVVDVLVNCLIYIINIICFILFVFILLFGYRFFCEGYQGFQLLVVFEKFILLVQRFYSSYMKYSEIMLLLSMIIL